MGTERIQANKGKVLLRQKIVRATLGNVIDDATNWLTNQKEQGTKWMQENTGDVVTEFVQNTANELVDLGKNTVVDKVKEIVSGSPTETIQQQTTVPQNQTVITRPLNQTETSSTNASDKNFIQKVNPGISFLVFGTITALITRKVTWTLAAASAGAIAHHAYRVNRS